MADDKKKKEEKPSGWNFDGIEGALILLFFLSFISTAVPLLLKYFVHASTSSVSFFGFKIYKIPLFFKEHLLLFKILGFSVAGLSAIGTFIYTRMADAVWRVEKAKLSPNKPANVSQAPAMATKNPITEKWEKILKLAESQNSSDWRLAIIEADIILDDLLEKLHLPGETMGEKLKVVEKSDFLSIESAWEAHKARNMIAHEGSDFLLNQRETRRIISLYEEVFKEFYLV